IEALGKLRHGRDQLRVGLELEYAPIHGVRQLANRAYAQSRAGRDIWRGQVPSDSDPERTRQFEGPRGLAVDEEIADGGRARVAPQAGARSQGQAREIRNGGPLPGSDSREGARRGGWLERREGANRSVARCHVRIRARPRTTPDAPYRPAPLQISVSPPPPSTIPGRRQTRTTRNSRRRRHLRAMDTGKQTPPGPPNTNVPAKPRTA